MATHDTRTNPSLPDDIIYLILSRLPVKSLLRFKTACRSWLSLISSRDFIKTHLSMSTNDPHYTHHHLLLIHWTCSTHDRHYKFTTCSVHSLLNKTFSKSMLDDSGAQTLKLEHPGDLKYVVGSCNGLVCLNRISHIYLWNPSTRKSRILPEFDHKFARVKLIALGFCYDELNDDFKVFGLFRRDGAFKYHSYDYKFAVYSSKYEFWRIAGDFPVEGVPLSMGKFANGAMHWAVTRPNMNYDDLTIVSIDVKTETCREVMHPKFVKGAAFLTLDTFGENLCILAEYEAICSDFWVMTECGVEHCWRKLFTIPHCDETKFITKTAGHKHYPNPIDFFVKGDILLNLCSTIGLYNTEHNTFKDLLDFRFNDLQVSTYVESLVSP